MVYLVGRLCLQPSSTSLASASAEGAIGDSASEKQLGWCMWTMVGGGLGVYTVTAVGSSLGSLTGLAQEGSWTGGLRFYTEAD